jgi:hypothetical protein
MRHLKCLADALVFVSLLLFASTGAAHAYVDPGIGSYVTQLVIAAIAGLAVAVRIYWGRIRGFLSRPSPESETTESDEQ